MVNEIILIILLFNGEVRLPSMTFEGTVMECLDYGDKLRVKHATHNEEQNIWFMNDGPGTWQGFICE